MTSFVRCLLLATALVLAVSAPTPARAAPDADAEFRALEYGRSGATLDWTASSHRGSIVPGKPYQAGNQFCRPYTHTVYTGSSPDVAKATACRSPDGTWRSGG